MKILLQTNNRNEKLLEHEYKKLVESGFEIVPFGYIETEGKSVTFGEYETEPMSKYFCRFNIQKPITLTGLEDLKPNEEIIARVSIPIIKRIYDLGIVRNVSTNFLSSIKYNPHQFTISTMPQSYEFLNKTPGQFEMNILIHVLDLVFNSDMFIKPDNDLKQFSGTLVPSGKTLRQVLEEKNELTTALKHPVATVLVSNNIQKIMEEVRCYVVNKKVVTISRYRYDGKLNMTPLNELFHNQYVDYAQHIIDNLYAPSTEFTIDLCQLANGSLKVVEYNCLNSSGLYECDSKTLFTALKEFHYPEK